MTKKSYQKKVEQKIYKYRRNRPRRIRRRYGVAYSRKATLAVFSPFTICHLRDKIQLEKNNISSRIIIPRDFSFYHDFDQCMSFYRKLITVFQKKEGHIVLDFSGCKIANLSTLTFLRILIEDFNLMQDRYKQLNPQYTERQIKAIPANENIKVKKYLHALGFYEYSDFKEEDGEVLSLNLIRGKYRNSYKENVKGKAVNQIAEFINESFAPVNKCLTEEGTNTIEALASEILNNAEDHSHKNCQWYVHGVAFNEVQEGEDIVEVNLAIINLGNSMYEGFEETKIPNDNNYRIVNNQYEKHKKLFTESKAFNRESLFMLYMLNEGISRLKYEDASRGNGTMQFLDAFTTLGCYGKENQKFNSLLNIISGHTVLSCDNKVGPYRDEKHLKLSLNEEKDLSLLPDGSYLKYNNEFFPGTIIECKIFLNKIFLNKLLHHGEN